MSTIRWVLETSKRFEGLVFFTCCQFFLSVLPHFVVSGVLLLIQMLTLNFRKQIVALRFVLFYPVDYTSLWGFTWYEICFVYRYLWYSYVIESSPCNAPNEYQVSPQHRPDKTGRHNTSVILLPR